jgi:tRNA-dihydrouridine synthase
MMDWTDNHYRTLARLISRRAWLYTEMIVADAINHQQENLVSGKLNKCLGGCWQQVASNV